jgi:hypothetical protein
MYGNLVNQRPDNLQEEFEAKNSLLRKKYLEVDPDDYLESIFPEKSPDDDFLLVIGTLKDSKGNLIEKGTVLRIKFEELYLFSWKSNAYIPYADFYKNYYHSKTLKRVRAFVVDIDNLTSLTFKRFLRFNLKQIPTPTYIVNSGKGIHLVYKLLEPQEVKGSRWTLNRINSEIQNLISQCVEVDKHSLFQPYRFPGFASKINTIATAFKLREAYTLEELMEFLKIRKPKELKKKSKKAEVFPIPNGSIHFYNWFCNKLFRYPPIPGRRHNSFFALGIVSYKCRRVVPKDEAEEVVYMVYEVMQNKNLHVGFSLREALEAFYKGYNPKAITVRWKTLCDLLGWEYRANKRNGKSREEHLAYVNTIRSAKANYEKSQLLPKVLELHNKGISLRKISEILGISTPTLVRWIRNP